MFSVLPGNKLNIAVFITYCLLFTQVQAQQTARTNYSQFDTTSTDEVFYRIEKVNRINEDSAVITIHYGKKDGIFATAEANVMSSHNSGGGPTRETVVYMGPAKVLSLGDTLTTLSVNLYKKFKKEKLLIGDMVGIYSYTVKNSGGDIFQYLATLDVLFVDNSRKEIKSKREILLNTDPGFEKKLLEDYTKEITDFYEDLKEYPDSTFNTKYDKGPFKGMNMKEVFKNTTVNDLRAFFQFVKQFPGKYMGNKWKINETYATWVLNNAPLSDLNKEWLIASLQESRSATDFARKNKQYIKEDSLMLWSDQVFKLQNQGNIDEAFLLCDKLITIAKELKFTKAEYEFYYTRSYLTDAAGEKKEAIAEALKALSYDKENINYA